MAAKFSLYRRTIPEILKPEGAPVEWRLIAWEWIVRRFSFLLVLLFSGCALIDSAPKEKIGVLAHTDITWPNSTGALKRALAYYKAEGVDAIVFLGDPTKDGYKNQLEVFESAWKESFKDGGEPRRILAGDSHTIEGITFVNRGRYSLTDLLCVFPLKGRTINAGSMRGIDISGIFQPLPPKVAAQAKSSAQGLLVAVREDGLNVRRLDFSGKTAAEVGPAWTTDAAGLIYAEGARAPEFWEDTSITVFRGYDKVGNVIYTVTWPSVLAMYTGERAFSYNVAIGGKIVRRVQSNGFFLPEASDRASVSCVIREEELEGAEPIFSVTPVSSTGKKGKTIRSR